MIGLSFAKIRSIQLKIALLSGVCLTGTVAILIGYSVFSAQSMHGYVTAEVMQLVDSQTKESLLNRAASEAGSIKAELEVGLDSARTMAHAFAVLADDKAGGTPIAARRAQFNAVLHRVLDQNPAFNGTYSAWEPNGLDGNDATFKDRHDMGSDGTGRFLPYWTRSASGTTAIQPLVEYDSSERHPNGLVKGAWYINPHNTGRENILGPLPYIVQGKQVFLATMSVPVMVGGKFAGVAGADYNLDFVQKLAERVNASIFDGKGKVAIVNDTGLIVADSANPAIIGKSASEADSRWGESIAAVRSGKAIVQDDPKGTNIDVFSPIKFGSTDTPWAVVISVPRDVVLAKVNELGASLNARATSSTFWQLAVGLAVAIGAIFVITLAAGGIAKPIRRCADFADGIAKDDFNQQMEIEQADEVGALAVALRKMQSDLKQNIAQRAEDQIEADAERRRALHEMANQFESSVGSVVDSVTSAATQLQSTAQSMAATAEETSRQSSVVAVASDQTTQNVQTVASATEELAASIQEIGTQVSESTRIVGEAVSQAVDTSAKVQGLSEAAKKIEDAVRLIDDIAAQTNLLALNATIEAARAGDAGKGFAVVAGEVKHLASQTARATEEIAHLVRAIQEATAGSVQAIQGITQTVNHVNEISTTIASAVEQQGAATQEISRNVQQAAQGTGEVSSNITNVTAAAQETGTAAGNVLTAATELGRNGALLKSQVQTFLKTVRG